MMVSQTISTGEEKIMSEEQTVVRSKPVHNKTIAILKHPLIEAVYHGLLRFGEKQQAMKRLSDIRNKFIVAKDNDAAQQGEALKLWIKDYELTDQEIKQGYRGNFGEIKIVALENGKFSMALTKLDVPLNSHPQKTRAKRSHPDWGHPILRRIQKAPIFNELEKANELLMALHEEYPNISIPGHNQLLIMIYRKGRAEPGQPPVQKFKFNVELAEDNRYKIVYQENIRKPKVEIKKEEPEVEKPTQGKFTAMVKLKKKRK